MDNYDVLYQSMSPRDFFTHLIKSEEHMINYVTRMFFVTNRRHGNRDDFRQEALLYAWERLPKTEHDYTLFKRREITWRHWIYKNIKWGTITYFRVLYPERRISLTYMPDVEYYTTTDDSYNTRFSSKEYEHELSILETVIEALPQKEQKMISYYLKTGSVAVSGRELNVTYTQAQWAYEYVFDMIKQDYSLIAAGKKIFLPVPMKFVEAINRAVQYLRSFNGRIKGISWSTCESLQKSITQSAYRDLDIHSVDLAICDELLTNVSLAGVSSSILQDRRNVLIILMQALVELNILRLNPAKKSRYKKDVSIHSRLEHSTASERKAKRKNPSDIRKYNAASFHRITGSISETSYESLKLLSDQITRRQLSNELGISVKTLVNVLKKERVYKHTLDKIDTYLRSLASHFSPNCISTQNSLLKYAS